MKEELEKLAKLAEDWVEFAELSGKDEFRREGLRVKVYTLMDLKSVDFGFVDEISVHFFSVTTFNGFNAYKISKLDEIIEEYKEFLYEEKVRFLEKQNQKLKEKLEEKERKEERVKEFIKKQLEELEATLIDYL